MSWGIHFVVETMYVKIPVFFVRRYGAYFVETNIFVKRIVQRKGHAICNGFVVEVSCLFVGNSLIYHDFVANLKLMWHPIAFRCKFHLAPVQPGTSTSLELLSRTRCQVLTSPTTGFSMWKVCHEGPGSCSLTIPAS